MAKMSIYATEEDCSEKNEPGKKRHAIDANESAANYRQCVQAASWQNIGQLKNDSMNEA